VDGKSQFRNGHEVNACLPSGSHNDEDVPKREIASCARVREKTTARKELASGGAGGEGHR